MPLVACPACRSHDRLVGTADDGSALSCEACGHRWTRELTPTCGRCGSTDLEVVATATLEEAGRGNQRTPSGIRNVHHCWSCGSRDATSSEPLPAEPGWRERRAVVGRQARRRATASDPAPARPAGVIESAFGTFAASSVVGGRWRLERLVRRSSTGTLWHAVAVDGDRRIAFKLVHPRSPAVDEHEASARAVIGVAHVGLLRVADVQRLRNDVLVVAAAVDAPSLEDTGGLTPPELLGVASDVAGALSALHARGLAHLDVRPGAVLVPAAGRGLLVDLGAGRVRARTGPGPRAEQRMTWLAPERIVAGGHAPPADVYSLGLTLWHLAGGRLDDLGATPASQAQQRLAGDLPALALPGTDAAERLAEAIAAATRRRPADRPTAEELVGLLAAPAGGNEADPRRAPVSRT